MKIKEVERQLSISRANIRFYEKEGLITTSRKTNNYRDYSEANIQELKKIILFRKLGFTVDEIKKMQSGELPLDKAAVENIARCESEIKNLEGALKLTKRISNAQISFQEVDENLYLDILNSEEKNGFKFADILKDYLMYEAEQFDNMWKWTFFHNFKESRNRHGLIGAIGILFLLCVIRGLGHKFIWQGTFWEGFLYPFALFSIIFIVSTILYVLMKKAPKAGSLVADTLLILSIVFLLGIVLLIIVLLLNSFLHFLF